MKTVEEILKQPYISAADLKIIIPTLGKNKCIEYIKDLRQEMENKNYFVPKTKPLVAHTGLFRKKYKIWKIT